MRTYHSLAEVGDPPAAGRVVAIGVFDGVHRGHQEILRRAVDAARAAGASAAAVTFYPHPDAVLRRRSVPPMLTSLTRKEELLETLGLDELVVVPFDKDFALLTPESFCGAVLSDHLGARAVFVGDNFRFGHGGVGHAGRPSQNTVGPMGSRSSAVGPCPRGRGSDLEHAYPRVAESGQGGRSCPSAGSPSPHRGDRDPRLRARERLWRLPPRT